jgi:hypothetical protein
VTELQQQRIQVRANILLGEAVDSDASSLDKTLAHMRQELHNLEGDRAAAALAIGTLGTALRETETAAKRRVAERLVPLYQGAVCSLHEDFRRCLDANEEVRRLHLIVTKQNLIPALAGDPAQKLLLKNVALNFVNEAALRDWEAVAATIMEG